MSKLTAKIDDGQVTYFPDGMFESSTVASVGEVIELDIHAYHPVQPLSAEDDKQKIAEAIKAFFDLLKGMAKADAAAPSFGSASKIFDRQEGKFTLTCEEGISIVRVYHKAQEHWSGADARDMGIDPYIDLDGNPTSEAWTNMALFPGQSKSFNTIENNAVTVALYG